MVKTSRKNLKRKNKYNSKKLNQNAGGKKKNKHAINLGFINHVDEANTYNYLVDQLKMLESNQGKSTSILFSLIDPSSFLSDENTTLKSRNTINNLMCNIKLVEDKFNSGLLYRQNEIRDKESNLQTSQIPSAPTTPPNGGGSNSDYSNLNNTLLTANNMRDLFANDPLYEEIFNNPLHGIKQMQDGKKLHLFMFLMPNKSINQYDLDYLSSVVKDNSGDYFIVLFPCLKTYEKTKPRFYKFGKKTVKEEKDNTLGMKPYLRRMTEVIGLKKEKTDFFYLDSENYNYGVYTKNLNSNFDLQIIPQKGPVVAPFKGSIPSTPLSTPSSSPNTSNVVSTQDNLQRRLAALRGKPTRPPLPTPKSFSNLTTYNPDFQIIKVDNNGDCFFDSVCRCLGTINDDETNEEIKNLRERFGSTNTDYVKIKSLREAFVTFKETNDFDDFHLNSSAIPREKAQQETQRNDLVFNKAPYESMDTLQAKIDSYKTQHDLNQKILAIDDFKEYLKRTVEEFRNSGRKGGIFYAENNVTEFIRSELKIELIILEEKDGRLSLICSNDKKEDIKGFIILKFKDTHYEPIFYKNKGFFKTQEVPDTIISLINRTIHDGGCTQDTPGITYLPNYFSEVEGANNT